MTSITFLNEQRDEMLANGAARARTDAIDPPPVLKLHILDAHATWLLAELAADGNRAYGLIDLSLRMPELGHIRRSDLASIVGPNRIPVRVDPHFKPKRTLPDYAADAACDGSINDRRFRRWLLDLHFRRGEHAGRSTQL